MTRDAYMEQRLRDLEAAAARNARPFTPQRLATLGGSFPIASLDPAANEWQLIDNGLAAAFRVEQPFDVMSWRFLLKLETGVAADVFFDAGIAIINPVDTRIRTLASQPAAARVDAAILPGSLALVSKLRSAIAEAYLWSEVFYQRVFRLVPGVNYAFFVSPRIANSTDSIWAPSASDTAFSLDANGQRDHVQLTALTSAAPMIEVRTEEATRLFTGGASWVRTGDKNG